MIHNTRLMLALGYVGLTALSIPAVSNPNPRGVEPQVRVAIPRDPPATKPQNAPVYRPGITTRSPESRATGADSAPTSRTEASKSPLFGWPRLVSEARKYIGTNPTDMNRRWCARFLNLVLAKTGYAGTGSDAARSFASYGEKISQPRIGAIAVLSRGRGGNLGHVGVISGMDARGNPIIISGNHGRRVGESVYPRSRVIAYVLPTSRGRAPVLGHLAAAPPSPFKFAQRPVVASPAAAAPRPAAPVMPAAATRRPAPVPPPQQVAAPRPEQRPEPRRMVQQGSAPPPPMESQAPSSQKSAFSVALESRLNKMFSR